MFKNSPYFIGSVAPGYAQSCSGGADPIVKGVDGVTGAVVVIYGADGVPIHNIGTAPAGASMEGTIDPNQKFRITTVASATATTQGDFGKGANFTTSENTAGTATYGSLNNYGANYSKRQIDPASFIAVADTNDITTASQVILVERSPLVFGNEFTAAVADGSLELIVKINPYAYTI
jgi:hypothetical protein